MPSALLKFIAVVGVIGVGSLMVLQVQQTLEKTHAAEVSPTASATETTPVSLKPTKSRLDELPPLEAARPLAHRTDRTLAFNDGFPEPFADPPAKTEPFGKPDDTPKPMPTGDGGKKKTPPADPPPFDLLPAEPAPKPEPLQSKGKIVPVSGTSKDEPPPLFGQDPKGEPVPFGDPKAKTEPPKKADPPAPLFPDPKKKLEPPADPGLDLFPEIPKEKSTPKPLPDAKPFPDPKPIGDPKTPPSPAPLPDPETPTDSDLKGDGTLGRDVPKGPWRPQLTIEKIAPKNAVLGKSLIYHIDVKNVGQGPADKVVVTDRIPKGTRLTGTIPQAEMVDKKLIWKLGRLPAGEKKRISIRVVPTEAGPIGSVATVNFVAEVAAETVVTAPKLSLDVVSAKTAEMGSPVDLTFKIANTGTGVANGVVLFSTLPDGLKHSEGKELEYERLDKNGKPMPLKPGESMKVTLRVSASKPGPQIVRASVKGNGGVTATGTATVAVLGSQLKVNRSGPKTRYLGRPVIFSNLIRNTSLREVDGATVVETIPDGMAFVEADNGGKYIEKRRLVVWRLGAIKPNAETKLQLRLVGKSEGPQKSTVTIYEPGGLRSETASVTKIVGVAALGLDMAGGAKPIAVGERIALKFNTKNSGTGAATNVSLSVTVPAELEVVSLKGPGSYTRTGSTYRFAPVREVKPQADAGYEIVLVGRKAGTARLKLQLDGDQLTSPLSREEAIVVFAE